jgi:hypothetical protein
VQAYTFAAIESAAGRRAAAAAAASAGLQPLVAHAEPATIPLPLLVAEISPAANADFGATSVFLLPAPAASPSTLRPTYERAYTRLHAHSHTLAPSARDNQQALAWARLGQSIDRHQINQANGWAAGAAASPCCDGLGLPLGCWQLRLHVSSPIAAERVYEWDLKQNTLRILKEARRGPKFLFGKSAPQQCALLRTAG